jgi:hypothetical protein
LDEIMKRIALVVTIVLAFTSTSFAQPATRPAATKPAPRAPQAQTADQEVSGPNAEVVDMVKKGVKESTVLSFVTSYGGVFDTSAKAARALSAAGVSDAIIDAMAAKKASPAGRASEVVKDESPASILKAVVIPSGVEVKVRLATSLSSKDNKAGETVQLAAADDLAIDGQIVIAKNAAAWGKITRTVPQMLRRAGEIEYSVDSIKAVDGTDVKITGNYAGQAKGGLITKEELLLDPGVLTVAKTVSDQTVNATVRSTASSANGQVPTAAVLAVDRMMGIYLEQGGNLVLLESSPFTTKNTASFLKMAATEGFGGHGSNVIVVKPEKASLRVGSSPVFYFYLETTALNGISNPKEFIFAKMDASKRERELEVGKGSLAGAGGNTQVKEDHLIDVQVERVKNGVFKVTPTKALKKGEYCFFGSAINKVFDFSVE